MEYPHPSANSPEIRLFLDVLNQRTVMPADGINSEKFGEFAQFHNLSSLVFYRLKDANVDICRKIALQLRPHYLANISHNLHLWNEFLRIKNSFMENRIAMVPLKGVDILARSYPAFDLRSMNDIDILIKEGQLAEAERALLALGYRKEFFGFKEEYWRRDHCNISFCKDRLVVDVHWGLDFKRGQRDVLPGIWDRVRQAKAGNQEITILSPEDAIFCFALHLRRFGNVLALKQVFDSAQIIRQTADFDWSYILEEGRRGRMQATLCFILMQVSLFTDAPVPEDVLNRLRVPFWQKKLIRKFLLKNTFLSTASLKKNYLKAHFLLFDNVWEAILYLINIPHEQFCKYYVLKPYTTKAVVLYRLRLFYMPLKHLLNRISGHSQ
jgi:hypothetical protein